MDRGENGESAHAVVKQVRKRKSFPGKNTDLFVHVRHRENGENKRGGRRQRESVGKTEGACAGSLPGRHVSASPQLLCSH